MGEKLRLLLPSPSSHPALLTEAEGGPLINPRAKGQERILAKAAVSQIKPILGSLA